ncbi:type VI secretion system protein TssA [Paracoccus marinaquae]|uniref:Type VI secretion system protein TssA n=1 Tax=Paracoccus marinaquae TaxID=2841926 RepID=A0ABS6ALP5_9RHOB|nr:type VI secretion system protein TssA [Paracoccus marinaquae]MBU3031498.1 type VI secretion system protein TssA [Paracoccus marinaquae]
MDLESLLAPLAGEQPSGVELRNDARFHSIERLLEPASRQHRVKADGSINDSAAPVDWSSVLSQGEELAREGRDLRLLVILVRGLYATEGFKGLSQGIGLLQRSVGDFWDSLYPRLRDRDDPQMAAIARSNALRQLDNDDNGLLGDLRYGIAFSPRGIGPVTFDDVAGIPLSDFDVQSRMASGLSKDEKDAKLARHQERANRARAACRAMAAEQGEDVAAMAAEIGTCLAGIEALISVFAEKAGSDGASGLSLRELSDFLASCRKSLETAVAEANATTAATQPDTGASSEPGPAAAAQSPQPAPSAVVGNGAAGKLGEINSRGDVEIALDRIVAFYERTEPSSPIPHVARRLRRMVAMDFLQLMNEIAPSGLKEFRNIAGLDDNKK